MIDVEKQIQYWRDGAEDWEVAQSLVDSGKIRHGLFFAHLTLEKALKALVCREIRGTPPKTHNLLALAKWAKTSLSDDQSRGLARMNRFQIEGRYNWQQEILPTREQVQIYMHQVRELYEWLKTQ